MIRNTLFSLFFFVGIIIISIMFLPALLLPRKITLLGGKLMGHWAGFCLRVFLSVKISIKGKEKIIADQKFFIAASHQSMFETFYLQTVFNSPVFILKRELLRIPIFGWYLKKIGSISINRNSYCFMTIFFTFFWPYITRIYSDGLAGYIKLLINSGCSFLKGRTFFW